MFTNLYIKDLKLPIVADDYGISPAVNQSILNELRNKNISIVSILPNYATSSQIKQLKKYLTTKSTSIHLNLVRGSALNQPQNIPTLVNDQQQFLMWLPF